MNHRIDRHYAGEQRRSAWTVHGSDSGRAFNAELVDAVSKARVRTGNERGRED